VRFLGLVGVALIGVVAAACGSSRGGASTPATSQAVAVTAQCGQHAATLGNLIGISGQRVDTPDVLNTSGQDFAAATPQRVAAVLLDKAGNELNADNGQVQMYLAKTAQSPAYGPFPASFQAIDAPGVQIASGAFHGVYAAHVLVPTPGPYFVAACYTITGTPSWASTGIMLAAHSHSPALGAPAPASDTPTLASTNHNLALLTTASPPDPSLYRYSVAQSERDHAPFVVVFATPKFCVSRLCGPVVNVVRAVRDRMKQTRMRFIHVEIYTDNDPTKGINRWVTEWNLVTEPWVFVVGADGRIRAKFEGAVGVDELQQAAQAALR
jgi:hypothetical protein